MSEKTITIKQIPFPTWEEFEKGLVFTKKMSVFRIYIKYEYKYGSYGRTSKEYREYICCQMYDMPFALVKSKRFEPTKQGYTEACEFLQAEWEKLIESMANLGGAE